MNMMDLNKYLKNPKFIAWLKRPNEELDAYWRSWQKENPDKINDLLKAKAMFRSIKFNQESFNSTDKNKDWKKINAALARNKHSKNVNFGAFTKVAAVIILSVASAFIFFFFSSNNASYEKPVSRITKRAELGQKLTIQLSDGTRIKLNSGSEITYPSEFSDTVRNVMLKGEGYFEVSHDVYRPFKVLSGNVITKVLGTAFCINSYKSENIKISLVNGSVEVNLIDQGNKNVTLMPGQKATWNDVQFEIKKLDPVHDLGWKDNILAFHNNDILDIAQKLERWYGVRIEVSQHDKIANSFFGEFENESLRNVLESIGHALEFEYQIDNKNVKIKPSKTMHEP